MRVDVHEHFWSRSLLDALVASTSDRPVVAPAQTAWEASLQPKAAGLLGRVRSPA